MNKAIDFANSVEDNSIKKSLGKLAERVRSVESDLALLSSKEEIPVPDSYLTLVSESVSYIQLCPSFSHLPILYSYDSVHWSVLTPYVFVPFSVVYLAGTCNELNQSNTANVPVFRMNGAPVSLIGRLSSLMKGKPAKYSFASLFTHSCVRRAELWISKGEHYYNTFTLSSLETLIIHGSAGANAFHHTFCNTPLALVDISDTCDPGAFVDAFEGVQFDDGDFYCSTEFCRESLPYNGIIHQSASSQSIS